MDTTLRLSKLMAQKGLCSRREADHLIEKGWVLVDGEIVSQLGVKVLESAQVSLTPQGQDWLGKKITLIINKPVGFVSAQAEDGHKPAMELVQGDSQQRGPGDSSVPKGTVRTEMAPAGRLDIDSKGLLILTNDGQVARKIIAPDSHVEKEYLIRVEGRVTEEKLNLLRHGLELDGQALMPAKVKVTSPQMLVITLTEGKKRQIRRMCEQIDLDVLSLLRLRIGPISLGPLPSGQWRYLSKKEVFQLKKL